MACAACTSRISSAFARTCACTSDARASSGAAAGTGISFVSFVSFALDEAATGSPSSAGCSDPRRTASTNDFFCTFRSGSYSSSSSSSLRSIRRLFSFLISSPPGSFAVASVGSESTSIGAASVFALRFSATAASAACALLATSRWCVILATLVTPRRGVGSSPRENTSRRHGPESSSGASSQLTSNLVFDRTQHVSCHSSLPLSFCRADTRVRTRHAPGTGGTATRRLSSLRSISVSVRNSWRVSASSSCVYVPRSSRHPGTLETSFFSSQYVSRSCGRVSTIRPHTVPTPSLVSQNSDNIRSDPSLNDRIAPGMHMTHPLGEVTAGAGVPTGAPLMSTNGYEVDPSGAVIRSGFFLPRTPDVTLFAAAASAVGQPQRMRRSSCLSTGVSVDFDRVGGGSWDSAGSGSTDEAFLPTFAAAFDVSGSGSALAAATTSSFIVPSPGYFAANVFASIVRRSSCR